MARGCLAQCSAKRSLSSEDWKRLAVASTGDFDAKATKRDEAAINGTINFDQADHPA
jgi:hypothetical protein